MKAKEFERAFERGQDVTQYLDLARAARTNQQPRRVNVDFPAWMIHALDEEAGRMGVSRQSVIKVWISECLKSKSA